MNIESVIFPETVHTIESYAFSNCGLSKVDFKDHIRNVGEKSFANNNIDDVQCFAKSNVNISESAFDEGISINYYLVPLTDEQLLEMVTKRNFNFEKLYNKYDYSNDFLDKYAVGTIHEISIENGEEVDHTSVCLDADDYLRRIEKILPIREYDVVHNYITYTKDENVINKIIEIEKKAYDEVEDSIDELWEIDYDNLQEKVDKVAMEKNSNNQCKNTDCKFDEKNKHRASETYENNTNIVEHIIKNISNNHDNIIDSNILEIDAFDENSYDADDDFDFSM